MQKVFKISGLRVLVKVLLVIDRKEKTEMTDEERMMQIARDLEDEDFKGYAAEKLRWVKILQDMGYTTDQAIKLMIYFCLNDISNTLGPDESGYSITKNLSKLTECIDNTMFGKVFCIAGTVSRD